MTISSIDPAARAQSVDGVRGSNLHTFGKNGAGGTPFISSLESQKLVAASGADVSTTNAVTDELQLLLARQMVQHMLPEGEGSFFGPNAASDHFNSILVDQLSAVLSEKIDLKIGSGKSGKA